MRKITTWILALTTLTMHSCGQESNNNFEGYTELEIQTEKCFDKTFKDKGVDFNTLKTIFEDYFSAGQISNSKDPIEKQYEDILSYWEHPTKRFPLFKDKKKVLAIKEKLGLTEKDIREKSQLYCFTNNYIEHKAQVDTKSSFYAFGSTLEALSQMPDISPGIIAGAIKMSMEKEDLKKELYQKTLVLMFCFDMTLFLTDGNE